MGATPNTARLYSGFFLFVIREPDTRFLI